MSTTKMNNMDFKLCGKKNKIATKAPSLTKKD